MGRAPNKISFYMSRTLKDERDEFIYISDAIYCTGVGRGECKFYMSRTGEQKSPTSDEVGQFGTLSKFSSRRDWIFGRL